LQQVIKKNRYGITSLFLFMTNAPILTRWEAFAGRVWEPSGIQKASIKYFGSAWWNQNPSWTVNKKLEVNWQDRLAIPVFFFFSNLTWATLEHRELMTAIYTGRKVTLTAASTRLTSWIGTLIQTPLLPCKTCSSALKFKH